MKSLTLVLIAFAFVEAQMVLKESPIGKGPIFGGARDLEDGRYERRVGIKGPIVNGDLGRLDGQGYASYSLGGGLGPVSGYGGKLDWIGNGASASVEAQHNIGLGTQINAEGSATIWKRGNTKLDATGKYSNTFGGPSKSHPDYNVGLKIVHNF